MDNQHKIYITKLEDICNIINEDQKIDKKISFKRLIFFEKSELAHFHPKKQAKIILRNGPTPLEL